MVSGEAPAVPTACTAQVGEAAAPRSPVGHAPLEGGWLQVTWSGEADVTVLASVRDECRAAGGGGDCSWGVADHGELADRVDRGGRADVWVGRDAGRQRLAAAAGVPAAGAAGPADGRRGPASSGSALRGGRAGRDPGLGGGVQPDAGAAGGGAARERPSGGGGAGGRTQAGRQRAARRGRAGHDRVLMLLARLQDAVVPERRRELADAQEAIRGGLEEVRRIAQELRPELLEHLGLVSALRALARTFAARTGIEVECRFAPELLKLDRDVELALYRIVQESLTNVARHAGATRVELSMGPRQAGSGFGWSMMGGACTARFGRAVACGACGSARWWWVVSWRSPRRGLAASRFE